MAKRKMSYRRGSFRKRRKYGGYSRSGGRRGSAYGMARRAYKVAKRITRGIETKFVDTQGTRDVDQGGYVVNLGLVLQGTDQGQRVGNKVMITSITGHVYRYASSGIGSAAWTAGRISLLLDREPKGAAPAMSDIWATGTTFPYNVFSPMNWVNRKRFKIIKQVRRTWAHVATGSNTGEIGLHKFRIKCRIPMEYSGGGNTIASVTDGPAPYLVLTTSDVVTTSATKMWWYFRVCYQDM